MDLSQLVHEFGGDVEQKHATVELIEPIPGVENVRIRVRIDDPGPVSVKRINTCLVKLDERGEVTCILQPQRFNIMLTAEFVLSSAVVFPELETEDVGELMKAILGQIAVGDKLEVLHIMPAKHEGAYCDFKEPEAQAVQENP